MWLFFLENKQPYRKPVHGLIPMNQGINHKCFLMTHQSILGPTARARIRWLQMLRVVRSIEKNIIKKIKKVHVAARHPLVACWRMPCGTLASLSNTQ